MAIRVRKLAKELNRSPWDVLGVLHALGYRRYRSPEDMLSGPALDRLRKGIREGVAPLPVERTDNGKGKAKASVSQRGMMSSLIPGVVPQRSDDKFAAAKPEPAPRRRAPEPPASGLSVPAASASIADMSVSSEALDVQARTLDVHRDTLRAERAVFESEKAELAALERRLAAERKALDALRLALDEERAALATQREAVELMAAKQRPSENSELPTLESVLQARGLRGADEYERALAGLASARSLADLLWALRVDGDDVWLRTLRDRLVLVSGSTEGVPAGVGVPVAVAPERAELPDLARLKKDFDRIGELFMLNGMRRALVIGGRPAWHRLLQNGIDPRIEMRFQPGRARSRADAEADVTRTDIVVLWDVEVHADADAVYRTARPVVVRVANRSLVSWVKAVADALQR